MESYADSTPNVVKPHDCIFLVGIPTNEGAFWSANSSECPRSFVRTQCDRNLVRFRSQIASPARRFLPRISAHGATVVKAATLEDLRIAFAAEKYRVVVLFTHCEHGGEMELFDGMHSPAVVASVIPTEYSGVLDMAACRATGAAMKARKRGKCIIGWRNEELRSAVWLFFYDALFKVLGEKELDYFAGVNETDRLIVGA